MSKKILKRSLVLGALMAFVITGSAWAGAVNQTTTILPGVSANNFGDFKSASQLEGINGEGWSAFYPSNTNDVTSDKLVTNGDITYSDGLFGLYAAYLIQNDITGYAKHLDNPNDNILEIKHNLTVENGEINLYAAHVGYGKAEDGVLTAKGNCTYVGDENNKITIKSGAGIYIGGAIGNNNHGKWGCTHSTEGNSVTVKNVVFDNGDNTVGIYGSLTKNGNAVNNEVLIEDTNIKNALIAGSLVRDCNGNADDSTVTVGGNSKIEGNIYAGYDHSGGASASNNKIILKDNADVSDANLYGNNGNGNGNSLVIDESYTGNGQIKTVGNFDEIVIDEMKYGEAALTVAEMKYKEEDAQGNGGTKLVVNKMTMSGDQELEDTLQVIVSEKTSGDISEESKATIYKGTSQILEVSLDGDTDGNIKVGEIKKTVRNEQVLVIGESRAAATAFTNQGSELIETGLDALSRDKATDTKAFAAVYGNASEFATGSEVKVNGWSGIVGVGKTNANGLTVGVFFENGEGNYRTYNDVNGEFIRGDGDACYNGGGFIVRKDNANGVYTEASLRAGNLQNELRNAVRGSEGLAGYDIDTFYYGAHIGVGKIIPRGTEGDSIDVYGKFIYTHHDSEDFAIDGDKFHFDSVDSERLRLGFRINEVQTNQLTIYYGAAWEYEFNGDSNNTVVGYDLSTPSLGGFTVIGEVGMHYKASEKWSFDLNGRAYSGQRDGFSGSVQANYSF